MEKVETKCFEGSISLFAKSVNETVNYANFLGKLIRGHRKKEPNFNGMFLDYIFVDGTSKNKEAFNATDFTTCKLTYHEHNTR